MTDIQFASILIEFENVSSRQPDHTKNWLLNVLRTRDKIATVLADGRLQIETAELDKLHELDRQLRQLTSISKWNECKQLWCEVLPSSELG